MPAELMERLSCHIGKTVTVFTTSGGLSGSGFTGVLASVDCFVVRLICAFGAPPACPIGSSCGPAPFNGCGGGFGGYGGYGGGFGGGYGGCGCSGGGYDGFWLGSIVEIPVKHIASFVHNAIGSI